MDTYEATRLVYTRIQNLDPENASKIMGFLLIQDHGEKEMIRLAFGPETSLHSLIVRAYSELGLSVRRSWGFSNGLDNGLISPNSSSTCSTTAASYAAVVGSNGADIVDDMNLQEHLSFLNEGPHHPPQVAKNPELFYPELTASPGDGNGMGFSNWGMNNGGQQQQQHRRSLSVTDIGLGAGAGLDPFGWKPCLYYAKGYCKNGTSCRFLHGPPDSPDSTIMAGSPGKLDVMEQCHEFLLRSKSQQQHQHQQQRLSNASQLLASSSFPYLPNVGKCMNFMLQQQQTESRAATQAAAAAGLMLSGEDLHAFDRARMERNDFSSITGAGMVNPGSRQIYLTFPADSTFREEDVSNYFSIYGPVQDVRIPYQQKRMFGFVTFVYPETVKLILAKGNPHFVCDARVLVKPYKEKGKVPDKKQQQLAEREFSPSTTAGHDHRDPFDMQFTMQMQSSPRMYNTHDLLLRRKLEEQAELQQAIELQSRKLMGLHLFDAHKLHRRNLSSGAAPIHSPTYRHVLINQNFVIPTSLPDQSGFQVTEDNHASSVIATSLASATDHNSKQQTEFSRTDDGKENSSSKLVESNPNDSVEHNLPDSPFASPTTANGDPSRLFFTATAGFEQSISAPLAPASSSLSSSASSSSNHTDNVVASLSLPATSTLDMASYQSHFMQIPRLSSDNGAVQM